VIEILDLEPDRTVSEAEYRRLLGYPRGKAPGDRAWQLAAWARSWYSAHGRPWLYLREVSVEISAGELVLDGTRFASERIRRHLHDAGADRAVLFAVSAGTECEDEARSLWEAARPDEYFFLEVLGSAMVEHLVAAATSRICTFAAAEGLRATPHFSPGYPGWDVAEQPRLLALLVRGSRQPLPDRLETLPSGMLQPKKSQLGVIGLTRRSGATAPAVPCAACSFSPCPYRRVPYRGERAERLPAIMPGA
jgi:hypothetical protein